jgi:DNA repair protein RadD
MVELRDYQLESVDGLRAAIRGGAKNVLLVAPTGSGKTVIGAHMISEARSKSRRADFLVDRLSLIQQTSDTFDSFGIEHGIVQADHWRYKPSELVQVCSQQTLARRGNRDTPALRLIDEAHTLTEVVRAMLAARNTINIGLTATPFTKGLGLVYDAVVNVTTTNELIARGFLSHYVIYSCAEPDMEGVRVVAGEFEQEETQKRALQVVGDVVKEYLERGEGRKFICSAVDTAHVEELQRKFLAVGINAATYTYKDREEDRADTVLEFRKTNSTIRGLITVTAASKGFDVPDIGCVIMARPLRSSLAEHIQFFGRGLRIAEGKQNCIILDHSGNCARFWSQWTDFFEHGISELDDGKKREKPKVGEKEEAEPFKCPSCGHLHPPRPKCPACGHEYPRKKAIEHVPGTLKELIATGNQAMIKRELWPQVVGYVLQGTTDFEKAQRTAQAIYKGLTGDFARARVENTTPQPPTPEVVRKIKADRIRYIKGQQKAKAQEAVPA